MRLKRFLMIIIGVLVCFSCVSCSTENEEDGIKKNTTNEEIAEGVVEYFLNLSDEIETTTFKAISETYGDMDITEEGCFLGEREISNDDLFDIHSYIFEYAEKAGVELDNSEYKYQMTGLPFNIPYKVKLSK